MVARMISPALLPESRDFEALAAHAFSCSMKYSYSRSESESIGCARRAR